MLRKFAVKILILVMLVTGFAGVAGIAGVVDVASVTMVETVHAQANTADIEAANNTADAVTNTGPLEKTTDQLLNNLAATMSIVVAVLNYLLWPVLVLIGALMDSELIMGGGMEERLLSIWTQIRNIVNLGFVLILVGVALYNVVGIDSDGNYAIKKVLPKLILGLVLVNFSFIGVKVMVDAANLVTTAMFALPDAVEVSFNESKIAQLSAQICKGVNQVKTGSTNDFTGALSGAADGFCLDESTLTTQARAFFQSFSSNNVALVMAVEFGKIHEFLDTSNLVKNNPNVSNLTINLIFSVVMFVVYTSAYLALLGVLLARVVVLWTVIALSPILALQLTLPDGFEFGGDEGNLKELLTKHLIAPIKIGFGMSVGYIMLSALNQVGPDSLTFNLGNQFIAPFSGISSIKELLIGIIAIAVVWKVTFSAASQTEVGNYTDRIRDWVREKGGTLAGLPGLVPIIPTPTPGGGGETSNMSISGLIGKINEKEQQLKDAWAPTKKESPSGLKTLTQKDAVNRVRNEQRVFDKYAPEKADETIQYALTTDVSKLMTIGGLKALASRSSKLKPDSAYGRELATIIKDIDDNKTIYNSGSENLRKINDKIRRAYGYTGEATPEFITAADTAKAKEAAAPEKPKTPETPGKTP
ncbi:hypothetical protein COY06_03645 [Candidatus Peregrinibacteria bacterium CG_4_10_14_0_2_um_filter_41_8]|nr:MAG: hypothetical protein COY06_03645 [Candidatus Peregrinibacteria bacterium CG_4_10_14_0_2_um_filter_41_8]